MEQKYTTTVIDDRNRRLQLVKSLIELHKDTYHYDYSIVLVPCTENEHGYVEVHSGKEHNVIHSISYLTTFVGAVPHLSILPFAHRPYEIYFQIF